MTSARTLLRIAFGIALLGGTALVSACSSPVTTTRTTSTEQTSSAPAQPVTTTTTDTKVQQTNP